MTSLLYGSVDYWDNRYSSTSTNDNKEAFEWLLNYSDIRHLLSRKYCGNAVAQAKKCRVLIAGCGTSQVGEAMLSDGFQDITNIDFSSIVIDQMKEKYTNEWHTNLFANLRHERKLGEDDSSNTQPPQKMIFEVMDLTKKLKFANDTFDLIVCKGTLDAVLCCTNNTECKIKCMMNECHRVLSSAEQRGVMMIISYGEPEYRLNLFDTNQWEVKTYTVPKPIVPGGVEIGG